MSPESRPCPREVELLSRLVAGTEPTGLPADLRGHFADCERCRSAWSAVALLRGAAAAAEAAAHRLPPTGELWLAGELRRRLRARERRTKALREPLRIADRAFLALALFAGGAAVPGFARLLESALPSDPAAGVLGAAAIAAALAVILGLVGVARLRRPA